MSVTSRLRGSVAALVALVAVLSFSARSQAQFGGMGGMGGAPGGVGGADESQLPAIHPRPPHPLSAAAAQTWLKLQQPVPMPFGNETPLEDVVKYIKQVTSKPDKEPKDSGIEIYVDPVGLQEAEKTMTSPVLIDLAGLPLATSLELLLKQLGLRFYVQKDGLLAITSAGQQNFPRSLAQPVSAAASKTWLRLHQAIDLPFETAVPLNQVLAAIKEGTKAGADSELSIYVDPIALQEAEKSMDAPISIDLKKVPAATCLTLITRQLGLNYRVHEDGIVMIVPAEDENDDGQPEGHGSDTIAHLRAQLEEAKLEAQIAEQKARVRASESGATGGGFQSTGVK
jgi:hypothetical protein